MLSLPMEQAKCKGASCSFPSIFKSTTISCGSLTVGLLSIWSPSSWSRGFWFSWLHYILLSFASLIWYWLMSLTTSCSWQPYLIMLQISSMTIISLIFLLMLMLDPDADEEAWASPPPKVGRWSCGTGYCWPQVIEPRETVAESTCDESLSDCSAPPRTTILLLFCTFASVPPIIEVF